ncbi:hypothetical protein AvCA_41680 [Azotobacter vinelandii CA]|uniref:Uncharacterized protein n=2 Tax=Azotobacter vinelandii TaxID=354 RepID=C1DEW9_AZOVD|nr:hypothetical protein Avin_41680 [Azotobacter vinelandii DJ]AGK16043.1 hypothetical protein AvCA_41680 [Azotobacter vinelandii CA]AGK21829.1 hypothetical protein AvCA6_41680 [Azotobacter vinelandii CA6]
MSRRNSRNGMNLTPTTHLQGVCHVDQTRLH